MLTYSVEQAAHNLAVASVKYHAARIEYIHMVPNNPEWDEYYRKMKEAQVEMEIAEKEFHIQVLNNAKLLA